MKKEKVKEDMLKGCSSCAMMALCIKCIMLMFTIVLALCIIGGAIETFFSSDADNRLYETGQEIISMIKEYSTDENNTLKSACNNITQWIVTILIFDRLHKLLKVTVQKETPFCSENMKNMKKMCILIMILYAFNVGELFGVVNVLTIIIIAMGYIFRYAYLLQQESDETL